MMFGWVCEWDFESLCLWVCVWVVVSVGVCRYVFFYFRNMCLCFCFVRNNGNLSWVIIRYHNVSYFIITHENF